MSQSIPHFKPKDINSNFPKDLTRPVVEQASCEVLSPCCNPAVTLLSLNQGQRPNNKEANKVSGMTYRSPKSSCSSFQLFADHNMISELAPNTFSDMANLTKINLTGNRLDKFPLNALALQLGKSHGNFFATCPIRSLIPAYMCFTSNSHKWRG